MTCAHTAFDAAFRARAPDLDCRPERESDRAFLAGLFLACSPMADLLPEPLMRLQAALQYDGYAAAYPRAMRRIVLSEGSPIGRLIVDWGPPDTHCIDIAVLPDRRATAAGPHLLRAWLAVADTIGSPATLSVRADNPARRLYARLGFVAIANAVPDAMIAMTRPVASTVTSAGADPAGATTI